MSEKPPSPRERAVVDLHRLRTRLLVENEPELHHMIARCNDDVAVMCACCSTARIAHHQCQKKWCPLCERTIAAERSERLSKMVRHFRWPLFATFTMPNEWDLSTQPVRRLKAAFRKLRHRRIWRDRVKGGLVCIEVTNKGKGWHVHLHTVIDCRWLSFRTPAPPTRGSASVIRQCAIDSKHELEREWAKCLKVPLAICDVSRANRATIAKEVVKYAVKGSELIDCAEPIGDIIRALQASRLMATFGHCHGKGKDGILISKEVELEEAMAGPDTSGNPFKCCSQPHWVPAEFYAAARGKLIARDRHILAGRKSGWWKGRIPSGAPEWLGRAEPKILKPERPVWNAYVETPMPGKRPRGPLSAFTPVPHLPPSSPRKTSPQRS